MPVANSVRRHRKTAGLTQEQLSQICCVSRQTIIAVELRTHEPSLSLAFRIAIALESSVDELFSIESAPLRSTLNAHLVSNS
jgi:putative transcriptional regulator